MEEELAHPAACLDRRRAGVLLHIPSLPGTGPCGDLGRDARRFVDFLASCGVTVWQTLPVGPTGADGSPYQSSSVHAGNPRFISLEPMRAKGWLHADPSGGGPLDDAEKRDRIGQSWRGFRQRAAKADLRAFEAFREENRYWLGDYTLFAALRDELRTGWWEWPEGLRERRRPELDAARKRLADAIGYLEYEQFLFFSQWQELKRYANRRGVRLFGDMPIFVALDSAEVWARREDFDLNPDGSPRVVAGVPPDYFSATGQRWGNPLYLWERMREDRFVFWIDRMHTQLKLFDLVRIDHFRGFAAYWEIPAEERYAINGEWVQADGDALFERLHQEFDPLPLVAEDLGVITPDVDALRRKYRLPGMKVLQFAFSGDSDNPYLPFHHSRDSVVYTGTHDNDTSLGWYRGLDEDARRYVDEYLGQPGEPMPWPLIRCALGSRSDLAILPMQDLLALGSEHRMNLPGTVKDNWKWRLDWELIPPDLAQRVRRQVEMYGRLA